MTHQKQNRVRKPIYLDYQATTPCDPRVLEAMIPYFREAFGNPHSVDHAYGWDAEEAVERARCTLAEAINADPREITFTSGATEANNLAMQGVVNFRRRHAPDQPVHIIVAVTEHKCVLECARALEREGVRVTFLPVQGDGLVNLDDLAEAISEDTCLVSIMAANNEIGVLQPLAEIGALCREKGVLFHCDAAQALVKIPLDVQAMQVSLMSFSSHKIYGPMGIGALYVRRRPRVRLQPLFHGGGQERGLRSGTLPTALCVGFGKAVALGMEGLEEEAARLTACRNYLLERLASELEGVRLNGHRAERLPGNLNLSFEGVDGESLIKAVPDLAISSGSACTSASVEPSYVLRALGLTENQANSSVRVGLGRDTTMEEVKRAADLLIAAVKKLRAEEPLAHSA
jgi:cysteine desulfurase